MRRPWIRLMLLLVMGCCLSVACSDHKDQDSEKGVIEQMTEKAGKKMADAIKTPVNKARDVKDLAEDRLKDMEEGMPEE